MEARELGSTLDSMRTLAVELPGGHLSLGEVEGLNRMLRDEAEKRR